MTTYHDGARVVGFSPWLIRLPLLAILGGVLLTTVLVTLVVFHQSAFQNRIFPGVSVGGVVVSGMTRDEARVALQQTIPYRPIDAPEGGQNASFRFVDGDQSWTVTAAELGVRFDVEATLESAFAAGRSGALGENLFDQLLIWLNGRAIAPIIRYDQAQALSLLNVLAETIRRPVVNAELRIDGANVTTTPGQSGRSLDINATLHRLDDAILARMPSAEIALVIRESTPVVWDTTAAADRVRTALSAPVTLTADDGNGAPLGPWTLSVEQIRALLRVETLRDGDGLRYEVSADLEPLRAYLQTLAPGLITTPVDGRFRFSPAAGQLEPIRASRPGRTMNISETLTRMRSAIFDPFSRDVTIAFVYEQPRFHEGVRASDLGIRDLLAQSTTYYLGSTRARQENIRTSVARFDGILIAPDEVFSFNSYVGDITPEEGYVSSKVIVGDRTVDGVGGGVCQVSTTAFQAAFYAGFPIIERYAHSYQVAYYDRGEGAGMDAAIYTPDLDFRFLNDTGAHVLIETSYNPIDQTVQFRYYGTNNGRQVVKQGPEVRSQTPALPTRYLVNPDLLPGQEQQVDYAAQGSEVFVTRLILDSSGAEIGRDVFYSRYEPWAAIIEVAPGDPRAGR